jgi:L-alanine-DL-glutamate epimerase-like enolase superfamily enzyme
VEMALWDLAGKAYEVPVYQMLGGRFRDRIRLYADTTISRDRVEYARRLKARLDMGYTFLKMDLGINLLAGQQGVITAPLGFNWSGDRMTPHPFTAIQLTDKAIAHLVEYVVAVREAIGYSVPLAADHFGHFSVNDAIRLGRALMPYQLAWLEDLVPWQYTELWKQITSAIEVPTLTGEDIYLKEEFIKLIDAHAVDLVHPDLASAGGILETKKIGDYAEERGVGMSMHFAGTPISFMANVHCAAATQNVIALEHHGIDVPWWEDIVIGLEKPLVKAGFVAVPDRPGLGIELNEEVIRAHLVPGQPYFAPTDEWNQDRSNDRLWS